MASAPEGYSDVDVERLGGDGDDEDPRPPFARDYDRLIYTRAFRRLQGKTQVVSPGEGDLFRTRLTHTIEVAQAARRLAEHVNRRASDARISDGREPGWQPTPEDVRAMPPEQQRVDADLCEAAAILHDLGHPPMGHAGEAALHAAVKELTAAGGWPGGSPAGFNGNAQSFRLAASALKHREGVAGLQLTRATLDASLKYPWRYNDPEHPGSGKRWNVDATQQDAFFEVRSDVPTELLAAQTIEAQIMDWADDMAYATNDADDWFRAGYMPLARLVNDQGFRDRYTTGVVDKWLKDHPGPEDDLDERRETVRGIADGFFTRDVGPCVLFREGHGDPVYDPASTEADKAFKFLRAWVFDGFVNKVRIIGRAEVPEHTPRRYSLMLDVPENVRIHSAVLKGLLDTFVVGEHRMATLQYGQKQVVRELLETHVQAVLDGDDTLLPFAYRDRLGACEDPDERLRIIIDYVSGMTDDYAMTRRRRLLDGEGRLHELPS